MDIFRVVKKFAFIMNHKQKIRIIIIAVMMLIGAGLETIGVSLIIPLITAVLDPKIIEKNRYVQQVCEWFDLHSVNTFMILVIIVLIFIFIFKNLFLFVEYYVQYRFVCNNRFIIQKKLVENYLHRPYEYFLNIESGEILRVINSDVVNAFSLLTTTLGFFTELIVSIALVLTIVAADPAMAVLIAFILGAVLLVILKIVKPILQSAGKTYQESTSKAYKWIIQAISGIKELKVAEKENYFQENYNKYGERGVNAEKKNHILGTIPRLAIEAFSVSGMLGIIALFLFQGKDINEMLPQFSAFAVAAVRLLPSVNRISAALNAVPYQEPMLDKMIENLKIAEQWNTEGIDWMIEKPSKTELSFHTMVELSDITYAYPNTEKNILEHANMKIPFGCSVGIVGASGSGKTTAVDIMLGLLQPQGGKVLVDGVDIRDNYHAWLNLLAYIPQAIYMLDDTIRANVAFGFQSEEVDETLVWSALEEAKLADFIRTLPKGLDTEIGERGVRLSGGQKQRIAIARALYTKAELLIFDEATSALDNETETAIMESINHLHGKKTLIIIAHRLQTIEGCDIIYRVNNQTIEKDTFSYNKQSDKQK